MKKGLLDKYIRTHDEDHVFAEESAMAHAALVVADLLDKSGLSQRELAHLVGVTEGRISQILRADSNLTVRTLARIGNALGHRLALVFESQPPAHAEAHPWPHCAIEWCAPLNDSEDEDDDAPIHQAAYACV